MTTNIDYITEFANELKADPNTIRISFENLFRLRIIDNKQVVNVIPGNDPISNRPITYGDLERSGTAISNSYPYITSFGSAFVKACVDDAGNSNTDSSE